MLVYWILWQPLQREMVGREAKTKEEKQLTKRVSGVGSGMGTHTRGRGTAAGAEKGTGIVRRIEEETETMIMIEVELMGGIVTATENGNYYKTVMTLAHASYVIFIV